MTTVPYDFLVSHEILSDGYVLTKYTRWILLCRPRWNVTGEPKDSARVTTV
jgi:hypothetical protein